MKIKKGLFLILSLMLLAVISACGSDSDKQENGEDSGNNAENFPEETIKFMIPYGPGGDTDIIGRELAKFLEDELDQSVVIENVEGAGGRTAIEELQKAEPDGHTILFHHSSMLLANVLGLTDISYEDLQTVGILADDPTNGLYISSEAEFDDLDGLVDYAKEHPGELTAATNLGNFTHMLFLAFEEATGIDLNIVDVGGGQDQILSVQSGRSDLFIGGSMLADPYVESGDFKPIGIFSENRVDSIPDIQTFKEQGYELEFPKKYFTFLPEDTPDEIVNVYEEALENITQKEAFAEEISSTYAVPEFEGPEEAKQMFKEYEEVYEEYKDQLLDTE